MIDPEERARILARTDILALIEATEGPPVKHSGRWTFWRCPFHEGGQERTPSLAATRDDGRWKCFGAGCGLGGNAIDWVMQRDKVTFPEACRRLGAMELPEVDPSRVQYTPAIRSGPPGEPWQGRAWELIDECQRLLWDDAGGRARDYLRSRGFLDDTVWEWRLGFQPDARRYERLEDWGFEAPDDGRRHGMWIPRGITIPCWDEREDQVLYVKFRRSPTEYRQDGLGKYIKLKGSSSGLYGAHALSQNDVLVLEEGEFNALTIWQEAGDLVDVASTGTSSVRPETLSPFWDHILMATTVLTRFDVGAEDSSGRWQALSRRVRSIQVPAGEDPNAYLAGHGGNVRAWIEMELARLELEVKQWQLM